MGSSGIGTGLFRLAFSLGATGSASAAAGSPLSGLRGHSPWHPNLECSQSTKNRALTARIPPNLGCEDSRPSAGRGE
jgi:hypothetical protein